MPGLDLDDFEFLRVLGNAAILYERIESVHCPYFHGAVKFNAQGFEHIRRQNWNRGRSQADQFMRLKHLAAAPKILRQSHTVQGIEEANEWQRRRHYGKWESLMISVTYYEFIAVLENRRFKVVVKQLPGGERIFWSLIPFWRQDEYGKRIIHSGKPALD